MEQKNMKIVYTVTERDARSFWTRIGVAFVNRDGSFTLKLDAVPLAGTIQLRDVEAREESRGRSDGVFGAPAQA